MASILLIGPGAIGATLTAWLCQDDRHLVTVAARTPFDSIETTTPNGVIRAKPRVITDGSQAQSSVPWLGGEGTKVMGNELLHPLFENAWPTNGPAKLGPRDVGTFEIIPAFGLPAINTLILLTSGVTVTIAHHALRAGNRAVLNIFLFLTFALGFLFVALQAMEYGHAYSELGLQLSTGIYGSTFFMLTGFHGFHVTLGAIMLVCIWLRTMNGHFTPQRHFAFEAVAWYWHFVDVVWLGLFIFVYWI